MAINAERFWSHVVVRGANECWEWTASVRQGRDGGYGMFWVDGKCWGAHRVSWTLHFGPIPDGLCVLHRCDNRPCQNPGHLFLGTKKDNNRDKSAKGRHHNQQKAHCPKGHPYDEQNTRYLPPRSGRGVSRVCRTCEVVANRRQRANARKLRESSASTSHS